ncbi:kinase-like protein, partial [Thelephora ganbajun]
RQLCSCTGLLPLSHIIPGRLVTREELPVNYGSFGDVWRGVYDGKHVAIKGLRTHGKDNVCEIKRVFYKEVALWKRLSHPNVVPFLGVCDSPVPLSMVSEWMPNGSVRQYVQDHPEADRLKLLLDSCHGLHFLHSHGVIHGDLKGDNILVDASGMACLGDFGLSSIASFSCTGTSAPGPHGTIRWMAPELVFPILAMDEELPSHSTKESDVYALAMVTIEVFTGLIPFHSYQRDPVVIKNIMLGERPKRPSRATELGLTDGLWDLIQSGWAQNASERPSVPTIIDSLLQVMVQRDVESS